MSDAEQDTRNGEGRGGDGASPRLHTRRHSDTPTPPHTVRDARGDKRDARGAVSRHRILIVAGETSGDKHAAKLIAELKRRAPGMEIYAVGGDRMAAAGATLLHNLVHMAVLGSVEVLRNYRVLRGIFYSVLSFVRTARPDAVVLVDYPGFNIRLAKKIKRMGLPVKVFYYISPQVWAWGTRRKWTISRNVDRMIVILPFEKEFYSDTPLPVEFVGHPALDDLRLDTPRAEVRRRLGVGGGERLVVMLPGSRWNEVRRHLPVMLGAAGRMSKEFPGLCFALCEPPAAFRDFTESELSHGKVRVTVAGGNVYELIDAADLVIVASGTATLETACLLKPMVIVYRVTWPTYFLGRMLVKLPYIGMVNVIAGRKIMPECIQRHATAERIAAEALSFLRDEGKYAAAVRQLGQIRARVGERGASARASQAILKEMGDEGMGQ